MDFFNYRNGQLYCESVSVAEIAKTVGTPCYIYSQNTLKRHLSLFQSNFAPIKPKICFSIKSLSNTAVIKTLVAQGAGIDAVSGGEVSKALLAGCPAERIVFAGVGKTKQEIEAAIEAGVGRFNIESTEECILIASLAHQKRKTVHASVRINPNIYDEKTHDKTTTGKKGGKFGIDIDEALDLIRQFHQDAFLTLDGFHAHIGSPIYSPEPYERSAKKLLELTDLLGKEGITIKSLNIGGGFRADYGEAEHSGWDDFAQALIPILGPFVDQGGEVIMEPGRTLAANCGILVGEVIYTKKAGENDYLILDAGMNDLVRPAMYDAFHFIWPVHTSHSVDIRKTGPESLPQSVLKETYVAGPICESGDIFAKARLLPKDISSGALIAIFSAGAYGSVMSSNYNARTLAPEVLVNESEVTLIRKRQSLEGLISLECETGLNLG